MWLISLDTNFSEIGPFGFSFSVWIKWGLVGSLTDGVLAKAILIFTPPNNTTHQLKEGKGSSKKYGNK